MKAGTEVAATQRFHLNSAGVVESRGGWWRTWRAAVQISAFFLFHSVFIPHEELVCICHIPGEQRAASLQPPGSIRGLRAVLSEEDEVWGQVALQG